MHKVYRIADRLGCFVQTSRRRDGMTAFLMGHMSGLSFTHFGSEDKEQALNGLLRKIQDLVNNTEGGE